MDQNNLQLFNLAKQKMIYLGERQAVISHNIANADTPRFKAKDVTQPDFRAMLAGTAAHTVSLKTTHPGHMTMGGGQGLQYKVAIDENAFETSPDGNSVQIDEQMIKMNDTALDYQMSTSVYKKVNDMIRLSLGSGGGG